MSKQILLDTNLLVYSIDENSNFFGQVHKLMDDDSSELFTTSKNLSEFLAVITRSPGDGLSIEEALQAVKDFRENIKILYPNEKSFSRFTELLKKYSPRGLKVHDHEIVSIALSNGIESIATVNKKDFAGIEEIDLVPVG